MCVGMLESESVWKYDRVSECVLVSEWICD